VITDHAAGGTLTDSRLEEVFLAICRSGGVARPGVNAWVPLTDEEFKVDFMWRRERLIVETDGHGVHGTRRAFERDRERDQRLMLAGWRVLRFTWRQVTREPDRVADTLRALLARAHGGP